MKTYIGMVVDGNKVIYVRYPGGSKVVLPKHNKHESHNKFDWSQSSSESLNTSLSLLLNAFAYEFCDTDNCFCFNEMILDSYQAFDAEVVAKLDANYWKMTQVEICDWVFDYIKINQSGKKYNYDKELVTTS